MTDQETAPLRMVTPIASLGRSPKIGNLRINEWPKGANSSTYLGFFRATAPTADLVQPLANWMTANDAPREVQPWAAGPGVDKSPDRFSVDLGDTVPIVLFSPTDVQESYEHRPGKVLERRCDGVTCTVPHPQGGLQETECMCAVTGLICKPKGQLFVGLPMATSTGLWQVHSGSYQAVGSWGRAAQACFSAAAGGPVADGMLTIGTWTSPKGRHEYPELSPVAGELTVSALRALAVERVEARAAISYGDWGDGPAALSAGRATIGARPGMSTHATRQVVDDPDRMQDHYDAEEDPYAGDNDVAESELVPNGDEIATVGAARFAQLARDVGYPEGASGKAAMADAKAWLRHLKLPLKSNIGYDKLCDLYPQQMAIVTAVMEGGEQPTVGTLTTFEQMLNS